MAAVKGIGTKCAKSCSETMLGFNLLGVALATDSKLERDAAAAASGGGGDSASDASTSQQILRLEEILQAGDTNGDTLISREEAVAMLRRNEVVITDAQGQGAPVWCRPLQTTCTVRVPSVSAHSVFTVGEESFPAPCCNT